MDAIEPGKSLRTLNYVELFEPEGIRFQSESGSIVRKTPDWLIFNDKYVIILDCSDNINQLMDKIKKYAKPDKNQIVSFIKGRYQKEPDKFDLCVLANDVDVDCSILNELGNIDHDYERIVLLGINEELKVVTLLCDTWFSDSKLNQLFKDPGKKFPNPLPEFPIIPKNAPIQALTYNLLFHLKDIPITTKDDTFTLNYVLNFFMNKITHKKARDVIRALYRLGFCQKVKEKRDTWKLTHKFSSTDSIGTRVTMKALELLRAGYSITFIEKKLERFKMSIGKQRKIRREKAKSKYADLTDYL